MVLQMKGWFVWDLEGVKNVMVFWLQGFKSRIEDVREEILRKRRAGKLPGDTTTVLKNWWQQHSKWPYPTVRKNQTQPFHFETKSFKVGISTTSRLSFAIAGRRQGEAGGGDGVAAETNKQLVHQPKEEKLAQQLSISNILEVKAQEIRKSYDMLYCRFGKSMV